jgi:wyosine [tRNA(Phe)-imidazoG37] synthetase (radical SAM superfamily)
MSEEKNSTEEKASLQEENWRLMTVLQIPWHHANKITDPLDRAFLMEKTVEVEGYMRQQQEDMAKQMSQMQQQQGGDGQLTNQPSPLVTPDGAGMPMAGA